ncbi:MAG: hypothetical protein KKB70_07985 [Proteobacteria bacterium]|nr:hypothetical protein [Pseudomonadota bacterium]MBU1612419.1 hypothetical protein [Pseudomonadota bacterium]
MDKVDKNVLQVAKEVVIKFIEVGRISPANFSEHFQIIYQSVLDTVNTAEQAETEDGDD